MAPNNSLQVTPKTATRLLPHVNAGVSPHQIPIMNIHILYRLPKRRLVQ